MTDDGPAAEGDGSGDDAVATVSIVRSVGPGSAARIGAGVGACLFVAWMAAAALIYILLGATGIRDRVNSLAGDLLASDGVSAGMYFGVAAALGAVEVVALVLLCPLCAVIYNGIAHYVGGLRVTLVPVEDAVEDAVQDPVESAVQDAGQDAPGDFRPGDTTPPEDADEVPGTGPASEGWGARTDPPGMKSTD